MKNIYFFCENIQYTLKQKNRIRAWISTVVEQNNKELLNINYIFTSDSHLLHINKEYLNHNTYTDIITFDQSENENTIEAEIYISIDRIKQNAKTLNLSFQNELHRVMIHGVLHLLGLKDKTEIEKQEMRKNENHYYLALLF